MRNCSPLRSVLLARSALVRSAVLAALGIAALLCVAPAASALPMRGHVFSFSFGSPGTGEGQFRAPAGVAVDERTGHVYVADRLGNRVEEFEPRTNADGAVVEEVFVRSITVFSPESLAVDSTSTGPSRGDLYVAGTTEAKAKKAEKENVVAADNTVFKFDPEGKALGEIKKFKATEPRPGEAAEPKFEEIEGLAVDPVGDLYVYDSEAVADVFNDAQPNVGRFDEETSFAAGAPGLALDSAQNLYVGHISTNVDTIGPGGEPPVIGKVEALSGETLIEELDPRGESGVAVDTSEANEVFIAEPATVGGIPTSTVASFTASGEPVQRFGAGRISTASGIAVDPATHLVYVADAVAGDVAVFALEAPGAPAISGLSSCIAGGGTSTPACPGEAGTVTLHALVDPRGAQTDARFEYGTSSCSGAPGACSSSPSQELGGEFGDRPLTVQLPGLRPGVYHYRVTAVSSAGTTTSQEAIVTLVAPEAALPDGRQWEMVSPPGKDGAEPEAITREGGTIQAAAEGGAISYVTTGPVPADSEPEGNRNLEYTQVISTRGARGWSSQDISTPHTYGAGVEPGRQEYRQFSRNLGLALVQPFPGVAGASALAQPPLSPPEEFELEGTKYKERTQEKTIYLRADHPLAATTPAEGQIYEAATRNGEAMHNAGFLALVTEADAPGGARHCVERPEGTPCFGGGKGQGVDVLEGTPDLSHVLLTSFKSAPGLYEWSWPSQLSPVSLMPDGSAPSGDVQFAGLHDVRNAVSEDGSIVFWADSTGTELHLYARDMVAQRTVQIDEPAAGVAATGTPDATFQAASGDGSRVFFTDSQRLTPDSHAGDFTGVRKPDLYVLELGASGEQAGCWQIAAGRLCDLTPEGLDGESGYVVEQGEVPDSGGGVLAASSDGGTVYFVANAELAEGAVQGNCITAVEPVSGRRCDLYMRRREAAGWSSPKLVAVLSNEDSPDWGGSHGGPGELRHITSRVSANGRWLAFMSRERLTGYDNEDATSKAPGEKVDEEVFLYDAETERLVCASCDPSGARPHGVFDPGQTNEGGAGEGIGLLVDRVGTWNAGEPMVDHWLAGNVPGWTSSALATAIYQSRYLDDSGRLFFNSPDPLVPAAVGAKNKVFEYEPSGVGDCTSGGGCVGLVSAGDSEHESAFIDASEDGNDVYFVTAAKLLPQDTDDNFDVYDAHICEAASPCTAPPAPTPPPCDETPERPCRGPAPETPSFSAPASAAVTVAGNIVPSGGVLSSKTVSTTVSKPTLSKAQKLARALKSCRKSYRHSKRRRQACERAAHKRYASKAAVKR